jgi:hypothetical protein
VSECDPTVNPVATHVATREVIAWVPQPVIVVPSDMKFIVPVGVPDAVETVAVNVTDPL